jgi:hypothetical protein
LIYEEVYYCNNLLFDILLLIYSFSFGQRYEIWINPYGQSYESKVFFGFSNNSLLTVYSKSTIIRHSRDYVFRWDKIDNLKIRNKSRNDIGSAVGANTGTLISYILLQSEKHGNISLGSEFGGGIIISTGLIGGGALIGYPATSAQIKIPLKGKSTAE